MIATTARRPRPRAGQRPKLRPFDLCDRRGDERLLVWGGRGQWMVVDEELLSFVRLLDGRRTLRQAALQHARRHDRQRAQCEALAESIVDQLRRRDLLADPRTTRPDSRGQVAISNVTFNLTNRCNLRCSFCYNDRRRGAGAHIDVDLLVDRLREAREAGLLADDASLIILGGEPLLQPARLLALIDRAAGLFGQVPLVSTNATLVDDELVDQLARRAIEVQISLDSPRADEHDALRGEGVYDRALAAAHRLVSASVHTILSMVYTRDNLDRMGPYLELAASIGAHEARFMPLRLVGAAASANRSTTDPRASMPDQAAAQAHLQRIVARRPDLAPLLGRDYFSVARETCRRSGHRRSCGIGEKVAFIDADGSVYPCPNHSAAAHRCGDLHQQSLAEIFASPPMRRIRRDYDVSRYQRCRDCAFRSWCAGDCRGEVLALTGAPHAAAPHCSELQRVYRRLLWQLADESR